MERQSHIRKQISKIAVKCGHPTDNDIIETGFGMVLRQNSGDLFKPASRAIAFDRSTALLAACLNCRNGAVGYGKSKTGRRRQRIGRIASLR